MAKATLLDGLTAREKAQARTLKAATAAASGESRKIVGLSLRLDEPRYERLRKMAFDQRVSMHELILRGIDRVLSGK